MGSPLPPPASAPAPGQPPPPVIAPGQPLYDQALADAVKRAQKRMGLEPSGVVGTATRAALNIPVQRRIDQIVANMERWRWPRASCRPTGSR
jgi:murein L,D-transpeptidase YcbB/YkuD